MAQENLITIKFEQAELDQIDQGLDMIIAVVIGKMINLMPEERKVFARVGDETEDWILKVRDYMILNPGLVMSHIDTVEFESDFASRKDLLPRFRKIEQIFSLFDDTSLLLGTDLFHNAITFYKGLRAAALSDAPGAKVIYEDLKTRFPGRPRKVLPPV